MAQPRSLSAVAVSPSVIDRDLGRRAPAVKRNVVPRSWRRQLKVHPPAAVESCPPGFHGASVVAAGTRPRSRSLSRQESRLRATTSAWWASASRATHSPAMANKAWRPAVADVVGHARNNSDPRLDLIDHRSPRSTHRPRRTLTAQRPPPGVSNNHHPSDHLDRHPLGPVNPGPVLHRQHPLPPDLD